jgi:2',3'-cyclic-nucleotide 2'-phosphodiesterase (5'-nucleotidase family)
MRYFTLFYLLLCGAGTLLAQVPTGSDAFTLTPLSTFHTGVFDEGAAEIVAYDAMTQRLFYTNADANSVGIILITDPANPTGDGEIDLAPYGDGVNSLAVYDGLLAVAVQAEAVDGAGTVALFNTTTLELVATYTVGVLPDMLTFTEDGTMILTANEGEPSDDYTIDPEGSVSIIDLSAGAAAGTVAEVTFTAFNDQLAELTASGVRIFGPGATVAQDLEPEYITVVGDRAYVSLQENNALAVVDINTATVLEIQPLGYKDHSLPGNGFDASNRDDTINITTHPTLGMYQPDAIASFTVNGTGYIVTANEGDARDYDTFSEEERVGGLVLDSLAYPDRDSLQANEALGRLLSTTATGDTDGDGDIDQIYSYGARSFSIFDLNGNLVYDSGDEFEQITAALLPPDFNSNNDENDSFDARSDDKGPEPEAVTVVTTDSAVYALIGLERVGGVMVYDITDPTAATFVSYANNRDFGVTAQLSDDSSNPRAGDLGVEDVKFISATDSPNGRELVVTANEVSGTVSIFAVNQPAVTGPLTLRILHNNDGESKVLPTGSFGGAARFVSIADSLRADDIATITLSSGDNYLPGPNFNANRARPAGTPLYDAQVLNAIGYDALAIGNHEFDFGPDTLARIVSEVARGGATFLSANLDFSDEPNLQTELEAGNIAKSQVINVEGNMIGVIGLTTPSLPTISSPRNVVVDPNLTQVVAAEVATLTDMGVNKIILISHLQSINEDLALATQLSGVDVIIAGGGDELLSNDPANEIDGQQIFGEYPIDTTDADGQPVYVVTTPGEYRYLGNLIVEFDEQGRVTMIDDVSDVFPVLAGGAVDAEVQVIEDSIVAFNNSLAQNIIAFTEPALDGLRVSVRTIETNQGNLVTDSYLYLYDQVADDFDFDDEATVVSVQNGGGMRDDEVIPGGSDLSELKTFDILPFFNFVSVLEPISAADFRSVMENSVSRVEDRNGRFLQVAGFEIVYDPNGTPDVDRIVSITLADGTPIVINGRVVEGAPDITIVTNSFTAAGGDGFDEFENLDFINIGPSYQQSLFNYLTAADGLNGVVTAAQYPEGGEGRIRTGMPAPPVVVTVEVPAEVPVSCDFQVSVRVNTADTLGGFTARLEWNPAEVAYGGVATLQSGFTGVINEEQADAGVLVFNGAFSAGMTGDFPLISADFRSLGDLGSTASVSVAFTAAAAARDFRDLRFQLEAIDGDLDVTVPEIFGDLNGDDLVNSTDALIALSFEAGLPLTADIQARIDAGLGDINRDGMTNSMDALIILTFDAGLPVDFPVSEGFCAYVPAGANFSDTVPVNVEALVPTGAPAGEIIRIPVTVDMNGTMRALGSYGAEISWDPAVLGYVGMVPNTTPGFESPTVNDVDAATGRMNFTHAVPMGAEGEVTIFELELRQLVAQPTEGLVDVNFTSMAAAFNFDVLEPEVTVDFSPFTSIRTVDAAAFDLLVAPNPAADYFRVSYEVPNAGTTELSLWSATGQRVTTLARRTDAAGRNELHWNGSADLPAGLYLLRLTHDGLVASTRVILR